MDLDQFDDEIMGVTAHRAPRRIQRKRTAGWRMPANTVCVTRPSIYGNPFKIAVPYCGPTIRQANTPREAVNAFTDWIKRETLHHLMWDRDLIAAHTALKAALARGDLRGKNLACWCALSQPCHVDVLLPLANGPAR
ncbi:DUF4326 domain-containing protein [Amycolatopsis sp. NPDC004368]